MVIAPLWCWINERQEQPVELLSPRAVELRQLVRGQHPGIHGRRIHLRHHGVGGALGSGNVLRLAGVA